MDLVDLVESEDINLYRTYVPPPPNQNFDVLD